MTFCVIGPFWHNKAQDNPKIYAEQLKWALASKPEREDFCMSAHLGHFRLWRFCIQLLQKGAACYAALP